MKKRKKIHIHIKCILKNKIVYAASADFLYAVTREPTQRCRGHSTTAIPSPVTTAVVGTRLVWWGTEEMLSKQLTPLATHVIDNSVKTALYTAFANYVQDPATLDAGLKSIDDAQAALG